MRDKAPEQFFAGRFEDEMLFGVFFHIRLRRFERKERLDNHLLAAGADEMDIYEHDGGDFAFGVKLAKLRRGCGYGFETGMRYHVHKILCRRKACLPDGLGGLFAECPYLYGPLDSRQHFQRLLRDVIVERSAHRAVAGERHHYRPPLLVRGPLS